MSKDKLNLGNEKKIELARIPTGNFMMGSPEGEGYRDEHPQHKVTFDYDFYMSEAPITQAQWTWVATNLPKVNIDLDPEPFYFKGNPDYPAESISWYMAVEFCERLSAYSGSKVRLPSEAEWEYACRAGTTTKYNVGDTLTAKDACFETDSPCDVKSYKPNNWGLYDMHGLVWEWCQDDWHTDYKGAPIDGSAWVDE